MNFALEDENEAEPVHMLIVHLWTRKPEVDENLMKDMEEKVNKQIPDVNFSEILHDDYADCQYGDFNTSLEN